MGERDELSMWVVYDHPRDFPHTFVAKRWVVERGHAERPTTDFMVSPNLAALRKIMIRLGLTCLTRAPNDDPVIVEVWL